MKNKTLKIIAVLLIAIALVTLATTIVRATTGFEPIQPKDPGTAWRKGNKYCRTNINHCKNSWYGSCCNYANNTWY